MTELPQPTPERAFAPPRLPGGVFSPAKFVPASDTVRLFVRPHPIDILLRIWRGLAIISAGMVALVLALGWIGSLIDPGISAGTVVMIGSAALLLRLAWSTLAWAARSFVLTDKRVIRVTGVLNRVSTEIPLARLQHFVVERQLIERALNLGSLGMATAGTGGVEMAWVTIHKPMAVLDSVRKAADAAQSGTKAAST